MYNRRTWLNANTSASTGSVVAYDGSVIDIDTNDVCDYRYLEIADCRGKITLHKTTGDTDEDFLDKMKLLRDEIDLFVTYLEDGRN